MAQWDVFRNPSERSRDEIPFLIDLQSDLLGGRATPFAAPLARIHRELKAAFDSAGVFNPGRMYREF